MIKLTQKISAETAWEIQARKFTTSKKVNVYFCLPEFSSTKIVTWKCHVDKFTTGRYGMILGRDLLTALGLDLNWSENVIIGGRGPHEGCLAPMFEVSNDDFKSLTEKLLNHKNPLSISMLMNLSNQKE